MKKRFLLLILLIMLIPFSCDNDKKQEEEIIPVLVSSVKQKDFPVILNAVGSVEAYKSIPVYAKVSGQIMKICFKEGQYVKPGDLLFIIDPQPFKEKLRESQADLAQEKATLDYYEKEAKRYIYLYSKGVVSKSDYDLAVSKYEQQKNIVLSKKAIVDQNVTNLTYCQVLATVPGKAGAYEVFEGTNIVANQTKLLTVNQFNKVYISFPVSQDYLAGINKYKRDGIKIIAEVEGSDRQKQSTLFFIDNVVNDVTGMIKLKSVFNNTDDYFWPGQYVNIDMVLYTLKNALVIPTAALQNSQKGQFVFKVNQDQTVSMKMLKIVASNVNGIAVEGDIQPSDNVVTDGFLNLNEGSKVSIKKSLTD